MKPLDLQVNILQMNNAAKEITKQKQGSIHQQNYAAAHTVKESVEKNEKVSKTDRVEAAIPPMENEVKDERSKKEKFLEKKWHDKPEKEKEKKNSDFFEDPEKGRFIDIKE
jgi:hypothetical protein